MPATHPISPSPSHDPKATVANCDHCGLPCRDGEVVSASHVFCCTGCRTVFELLEEHGLGHYYRLESTPGISMAESGRSRFEALDDTEVASRLLDFQSDTVARVTFSVPAIHCVACVWLLENLFRLEDGIGETRVDFPRRRVTTTFDPRKISLRRLAELLTQLGYEPTLTLDTLDRREHDPVGRRLALQLGVTGFCFGNIMLLAFPAYLGLEPTAGLGRLFSGIALLLSIPVITFGAADYWRAAWLGIRRRVVTIDFPIALGLAALFGESVWQIVGGRGEGYLDSLAALVFLLLCGRWFQRKTYDRLSFDRDYTAYFPLAVTRKVPTDGEVDGEETVPLTAIAPGDRLVLRNGELIPADGRLEQGRAAIDYSFVTGESVPVARELGETLYAGGRQVGSAIEMTVERQVSESYLVSLWGHEAFRRGRDPEASDGTADGALPKKTVEDMTQRISKGFTLVVVSIATLAAGYWWLVDPSVAVRAFTSVLIVACPCALALAAPFGLGTALRVLGRRGLYLRDTSVVEGLARVERFVFDKTGTLTRSGFGRADYHGKPLSSRHRSLLGSLLGGSVHPYARRARQALGDFESFSVSDFHEEPGRGLVGRVDGSMVVCGSLPWLREQGVTVPLVPVEGGIVLVAIDGRYRGRFTLRSELRGDLAPMFRTLRRRGPVVLASGDNDRERHTLFGVMGPDAELAFGQSPHDKLALVEQHRAQGRVLMVGDGLNDAGALEAADVGIAVSEDTAAFTPACDAILEADRLSDLPRQLEFARRAVRVVVACFLVSFAYNVVGITFAASGNLSPLISAVLMPTSSATVVALAIGRTRRLAQSILGET